MEQLYNGFTLDIPAGVFPLSTDSMALSGFVKLPKNAKILDLGSGSGCLGLLLCAKDPNCTVTGIELDATAHEAALDNIRRNHLSHRLSSICEDLRHIPSMFPAGSFQCCISNPPYFDSGPASRAHPGARREDHCSLSDLFHAAAWALQYGGSFFLVHRPERLAELICCANASNLEPKRLCLIRHRENGPVSLVMLACQKGSKPGLRWEDLILFNTDGTPTPAYRELYHL